MAPMVLAVSNAVAKDALCVNDMECGGKCFVYTNWGQKTAAKYFEHIRYQSVGSVLYIVLSTKLPILH